MLPKQRLDALFSKILISERDAKKHYTHHKIRNDPNRFFGDTDIKKKQFDDAAE